MKHQTNVIARMSIGLAAAVVTCTSWAQQTPSKTVVTDESPIRQPPTNSNADGKSVPVKAEKLVLADPDTKLYMPCRDENDSLTTEAASKSPKLNPKAAVLSEEAAKQHGYRPSAHKVICPKP